MKDPLSFASNSFLSAVTAYGKPCTLERWLAGGDFRILTPGGMGPYFSVRDVDALRKEGYTRIYFLGRDSATEFFYDL